MSRRFLSAALMLLPFVACAQKGEDKMVREPAVANQFYPGNRDTLSLMLDQILASAPRTELPGPAMGIVVPHAGYPYSGPTAAYAYKAIAGSGVKTVVMLGPSHHVGFQDMALFAKGAWKTPLGNVPIDSELAAELMKQSSTIKDMPQAHADEHSLEVQVPFLQKVLKDFKILPISIAFADYDQLQTLAQALATVTEGKSVLFLASSDLYHGDTYRQCKLTDSVTLSFLERLDPKGLYEAIADEKAMACGGLPIVALMLTMQRLGVSNVRVLHRTNSNDVTGEHTGYCVGYAATVFYQNREAGSGKQGSATEAESGNMLSRNEQQELLRIARTTLDSTIRKGKLPRFTAGTERLKELRGVFVTLKEHGDLCGCIGYIEGFKPLFQAVSDMAVAASTEDYRFPPVQAKELKDIDIEITVLTPLQRVHDPTKDVIAGKHGIVVKQGGRQGVFLPQVATEQNWNTETFLSQCCAGKAGLPADAWRSKDCEVYVFEGQVFGEKE